MMVRSRADGQGPLLLSPLPLLLLLATAAAAACQHDLPSSWAAAASNIAREYLVDKVRVAMLPRRLGAMHGRLCRGHLLTCCRLPAARLVSTSLRSSSGPQLAAFLLRDGCFKSHIPQPCSTPGGSLISRSMAAACQPLRPRWPAGLLSTPATHPTPPGSHRSSSALT